MADAHAKQHDYHIIDPSPWPFLGSVAAFVLAIGGIGWMQYLKGNLDFSLLGIPLATPWLFFVGLALVFYVMFAWWSDTIREAHEGHHTRVVSIHLRYGMIMFIASEVMFFAAFFWAFFASAFYPTDAIGGVWPPADIITFDPFDLPFINTLILLLSGCTVTWAHHALLEGNRRDLIRGLWLTVLLGMCFTALQAFEYSHAAFGFTDGIYASTFYMATGFHGFHVIVGTIFLAVCLFRAYQGDFTPQQHFGFEAAAWYWHFVDVVWLFLFVCVYWWGA